MIRNMDVMGACMQRDYALPGIVWYQPLWHWHDLRALGARRTGASKTMRSCAATCSCWPPKRTRSVAHSPKITGFCPGMVLPGMMGMHGSFSVQKETQGLFS